jgi:hypothetical protein
MESMAALLSIRTAAVLSEQFWTHLLTELAKRSGFMWHTESEHLLG